ncbi:hypothetical protein H5410_045266 [Solanum commersonii]|uniref:Uncharacterized protein n=1 Tax=Solanum commersonii TaxID=4109 RepID=A0A9J5XD71_SOLCO|nr:hypothetical protein H5410_045266 [Solanum commersonii]
MEEQKLELKLQVEKFIEETRGAILTKHLKFHLNIFLSQKRRIILKLIVIMGLVIGVLEIEICLEKILSAFETSKMVNS